MKVIYEQMPKLHLKFYSICLKIIFRFYEKKKYQGCENMFNFFADKSCRNDNKYYLTGTDFNHIKNVLRMKEGDTFLVSCSGKSDLCRLEAFEGETVIAEIEEENYQNCELPARIYLFQGLPKSDKMELIIQKCVELGVTDIVPVEMSRSIVKIEEKKKQSKITRWQAIAESAAKQSKRNLIPEIHSVVNYNQAIDLAKNLDLIAVPYENKDGMISTANFLNEIKPNTSIGIFIGPEGGFEEKEIEMAKEVDAHIISLGKRILRTETAAITAIGMCMLYIELNGENQ